MASQDEAAETTASEDGAGVAMATHNNIAATTTPEMNEDQIPPDDEYQFFGPSVSHGQIDGNTNTEIKRYVSQPPTLMYAKVQGLAMLKEMLNDPDGGIAHNIKKTSGWNVKSLASNEKCKKVRQFLTDKEVPLSEKTVPFILATWCMLGGFIPSMWHDKVEGEKRGSKAALTESGKKMVDELEHLGGRGEYEYELCKRYATRNVGKMTDFDWTETAKGLEKSDNDARKAKKKSTPDAQPTSLGKHVASSPRQPPAAKRPMTVAPQRRGDSYADDDDIKDEEGQVEVDGDVMDGSKRKGAPNPETTDAPLPRQKKFALPGAHLNQGLDNSLGNGAGTRVYGPGLKTSKMSRKQKFTGRKSQWNSGGYSIAKPSVTADVLSSPYRSLAASSGQAPCSVSSAQHEDSAATFGMSPPLERGLSSQPSLALFPSLRRGENVATTNKAHSSPQPGSTTTNLGDPDSLHEAVSYHDGAEADISGARPRNSSHDIRHSMAQSSEQSAVAEPNEVWLKLRQQGKQPKATTKKPESRVQWPTHRDGGLKEGENELGNLGGKAKEPSQRLKRKDEQSADAGAVDGTRGPFVQRSNRDAEVEIDKLKAEIQKLNEEKETQRIEMMGVRRELQIEEKARGRAIDASLKKDRIIQEYKVKLERMMSLSDQNDHLKGRISKLEEALDASRQTVEESNAKIAALEEAAKTREGVIDNQAERFDTTTAQDILQATTTAAKDKGLAMISLTELLVGMFQENDDGSGTSGPKDSETHQGHDDGADEETPPGPEEKTVEVAAASAGLGEHEGQEDDEGQGENRAGHTGFSPMQISTDSDSDSDSGGY